MTRIFWTAILVMGTAGLVARVEAKAVAKTQLTVPGASRVKHLRTGHMGLKRDPIRVIETTWRSSQRSRPTDPMEMRIVPPKAGDTVVLPMAGGGKQTFVIHAIKNGKATLVLPALPAPQKPH
jgi:hypothetical protein